VTFEGFFLLILHLLKHVACKSTMIYGFLVGNYSVVCLQKKHAGPSESEMCRVNLHCTDYMFIQMRWCEPAQIDVHISGPDSLT